MSVQWTENQRRAIDARGGNVLVSAAAGSGKTAVLVERVIRRVTDAAEPVLINRLLIATFTNAAAAEMRERVHAALSAELERHPEHAFLRKQLVLLGQAQITTVHAFCQNLIKDNFHALDIPVDFEIGDEAKTVPLLRQAAEAVLNGHYEQQEEAFFRTVDAFGGKKTDDDLIEMLFALYRFSRSLAHPDEWLGRCADGLRSESDVEAYAQVVFRQARIAMSGLAALYGAALERIEADEGLKPYEPLFRRRACRPFRNGAGAAGADAGAAAGMVLCAPAAEGEGCGGGGRTVCKAGSGHCQKADCRFFRALYYAGGRDL